MNTDGINGLTVAGPELLNGRELIRRFDTKFGLPRSALDAFFSGLRGVYAVLPAGDKRFATYDTQYFDTDDWRCLRDHLRGRRPRHKVRVRHYPDRHISFIEQKTKTNKGQTHKRRLPIDPGRFQAFDPCLLDSDLRAWLQSSFPVSPDKLTPKLRVFFRRGTLLSLEGPERMTVDTSIRFAWGTANAQAGTANAQAASAIDRLALIEIKQPRPTHSTPAIALLRQLGAKQLSFSKYCFGINQTRPSALEGIRFGQMQRAWRPLHRLSQNQ